MQKPGLFGMLGPRQVIRMERNEKWDAVMTNDSRCDGLFFCGVKSTGIYCRPSCASKTPKPENVRFFDSAREAEQAGFRPCKRCRPDLVAYDPAAELAQAAKRLIDRSFSRRTELRQGLGALGVTRRHLTEIFEKQYDMSPEQYAAQVRLERAKVLLREGSSVTDTAFAVGMETPAAFSAFFQKQTGMSPTEYIAKQTTACPYGFFDTPLGTIRIAENENGITSLRFADDPADQNAAMTGRYLADAAAQIRDYCAGVRKTFDVPLSLWGSDFQKRVWRALRNIPYGETRSYQQIAAAVGNEKAARAVGMANNRNPILIMIPCHRVVGKDGTLVGYAGGIERKRHLLELEAGFGKTV